MKPFFITLFYFFFIPWNLLNAQDSTSVESPNIVLILVDDAALMDFACYGGEANTPNIDRLAKAGTMFTNYHASPMCAPSRSMLMMRLRSRRAKVICLPKNPLQLFVTKAFPRLYSRPELMGR